MARVACTPLGLARILCGPFYSFSEPGARFSIRPRAHGPDDAASRFNFARLYHFRFDLS